MKFTKKIKEDWLNALKSGKFKQGFGELVSGDRHCCIGVLGEIHPKLKASGFDMEEQNLLNDTEDEENPYGFLNKTIGHKLMTDLYERNDEDEFEEEYENDYSNVIPFIEDLETEEE